MNIITHTLTIAAFITAASTASASRGPEVRFNTAPKNAPVVQDQSYKAGPTKHGGRHGHRNSHIKVAARSKVAPSSTMSATDWNFQSDR